MSAILNPNEYPQWLSIGYCKEVLREYLEDNSIEIKQMDVAPAAAKGEHFLCAVYRVTLAYGSSRSEKIHHISYIVKTRFMTQFDQSLDQSLETGDLLTREMHMYRTILPKIINLLSDAGYKAQLVPQTIKVDWENGCIILEDLCYRQFSMGDKRIGLDLDHMKLALMRVAEYHAAAARLNEIEAGSLEKLNRSVFINNDLEPFFTSQLEACGRAVQKWEGYEVYGEKISKLVPHIMELGRKLFTPKSSHFNTLLHSDFWMNNIMFRHDENQDPVDCVLIDFQFNSWQSPAIDVHYFLKTSVNDEIRWDYFDELVHFYYQYLAEVLRKLEYKERIPSAKEFVSQFMDKSFNEVTSACVVVPLILNQQKTEILDNDADAIRIKETAYNEPKTKEILQKLLPSFDARGLLEVNQIM